MMDQVEISQIDYIDSSDANFNDSNSLPGTAFLNASVIIQDEPEAPTISLGEKIIWLQESSFESGIVKWIGRIPFICADWTAGIEFDNPVGNGNGQLNGKRYFTARESHAFFMPLLGLLRAEDYFETDSSLMSVALPSKEKVTTGLSNLSSDDDQILVASLKCNCEDNKTNRQLCNSEDQNTTTKQKRITSYIIGSLKRTPKKKKKENISPLDQLTESPKCVKSRKNSTYSVESCPAVVSAEDWTVIDSDSDIEYKNGFHVLMSCFTLGSSHKQKKRKITTRVLENKTVIYTPEASVISISKSISSSDKTDCLQSSNSISNLPTEVSCCSSPKQTFNDENIKNSLRKIKRKKKRKAPLPPIKSLVPSENTYSSTTSTNGLDDLPTTIGKLYQLNKISNQNKQAIQKVQTEVSLLCQEKYARVLVEKVKENKNSKQEKISPGSSVVLRRKSPKKRPAPKPPQHVPPNKISEATPMNQLSNIITNETKLYEVMRNGIGYNDFNIPKPTKITISDMNVKNDMHREHIIYKCVECQKDAANSSYLQMPYFVCPILPKDIDSYNITVLGYCSIDQKNHRLVINKENQLCTKDTDDALCHCHRCKTSHITDNTNRTKKNSLCLVNGDAAVSNEYVDKNIIPFIPNDKFLCCHQSPKSKTRHGYNIRNESICTDCLNHGTKIPCVCLDSHLEPSDDSDGNDMLELPNTSKMHCIHGNRKTKFSHNLDKLPLKHHEKEFGKLEEFIKSTPTVSDFIAAFNYLTQKTNSDLDLTNNKHSLHLNFLEFDTNHLPKSVTDNDEYDLKSLPTKWRYAPVDADVSDRKAKYVDMENDPQNKNYTSLNVRPKSKNKSVTFESSVELENKPVKYSRYKRNYLLDTNDNVKQNELNSHIPYNYLSAHRHAWNQEIINSQRNHVSKPNRKTVMSNVTSKETNMFPVTTKPPLPVKQNSNIRNHGYRKSYRAPPIPDNRRFSQKSHSSIQVRNQNDNENPKKSSRNETKECQRASGAVGQSADSQKQIWVSLYIEDKSSHKGLIPLLVSPQMTLRMLKIKLERQFGYPRDLQRWILGKSFATEDNATLSSYDVTEAGCPVFLYMTEKNLERSYENFVFSKNVDEKDTSTKDSDSDSDITTDSDSGTVILASDTDFYSESSESSGTKPVDWTYAGSNSKSQCASLPSCITQTKRKDKNENKRQQRQDESLKKSEIAKENYKRWMEVEDQELISNLEPFECPICFVDIQPDEGVMLKDCLHLFCRECLTNTVYYSEEAVIKCPFRNDEYSCDSYVQEREIKSLVSAEIYERHLQRSIKAAENQAQNSFHCKTPNCPGWCLYEDKVNLFLCPVCSHLNCLTCQAIHEGRNCRQYQDELEYNSITDDDAKQTKDYLDNMLKEGQAMRCPQCHIILMKKWGCDWLKCSVCLTEICWVTRGFRWGPAGKGDTSGGCKCGVHGVRCHPKCNYCH